MDKEAHMKATRLLLFLAAVLVLAGCAGGKAADPCITIDNATLSEPRVITVAGTGEVKVVPDRAILRLGVQTIDRDLVKAKAQNDEIVQRFLLKVADYEISDEDFRSDQASIGPVFADYGSNNLTGYQVRRSFMVTINDLATLDSFLTDILLAGVNQVYGVDFRTADLQGYRDQARALAIQDAKRKADLLASELGQEVGEPLKVEERSANSYMWGSWSGFGSGSNYAMMAMPMMAESSGTSSGVMSTFAPGEITVVIYVTVAFTLK
jgi:uncharacterized protein YggE